MRPLTLVAIDHVLGVIENHRQANESVLRSLAIDLTNEIRGERIRFVEAMQQATTVNVNCTSHVSHISHILASCLWYSFPDGTDTP